MHVIGGPPALCLCAPAVFAALSGIPLCGNEGLPYLLRASLEGDIHILKRYTSIPAISDSGLSFLCLLLFR